MGFWSRESIRKNADNFDGIAFNDNNIDLYNASIALNSNFEMIWYIFLVSDMSTGLQIQLLEHVTSGLIFNMLNMTLDSRILPLLLKDPDIPITR